MLIVVFICILSLHSTHWKMFQRVLILTSSTALTIIALLTAHHRPKNHGLSSIDDFSQRCVAGAVVHGLLCHRGSYPVHSKPSMVQVLLLTACTIRHQLVTHCHPTTACFGRVRSCVELFDDASERSCGVSRSHAKQVQYVRRKFRESVPKHPMFVPALSTFPIFARAQDV